MNEYQIKKIGVIGFVLCIILLILTLLLGDTVKGAKRWLSLPGISLQPSELIKPFYAIVIAMILSSEHNKSIKNLIRHTHFGQNNRPTTKNVSEINSSINTHIINSNINNDNSDIIASFNLKRFYLCFIIHIFIILLLILQPDFGMTVTISVVTGIQLFVAGLPWIIIILILCCFIGLGFFLYHTLPYIAKRIDSFTANDDGYNYQVQKSLESYTNGGFFGTGPGEGSVKYFLPDSHADFIFAVAGEEMGAIFCIFIVLLIAFIVLRTIINISKLNNTYSIYVGISTIMYVAFQAIFNIGVTMHLFPTKGMTLPFISYGGSSIIASSISIGICLSAMRHHAKFESCNITTLKRKPHIKL